MTYKPFIKLFRTPNSQYFYDVGKNEIVRITRELFAYLQGLLDGVETQLGQESQEMFDSLRDAGYLSDKHPQKIQHPYLRILPDLLERKIENLILQLTQDCNFRCKYCIYSEDINTKQRSHSKKEMTWESAKKAIDFYRDHSVDSASRNIGLYGGEPLLNFSLVRQVIDYAEKELIGKPLTFSLTTNGSLLTTNIIDFLAEHGVNMMISIDGPKSVNDKNRIFKNGQGTFDSVINKIKLIKDTHPEYAKKVRINMVVDTNNEFDLITSSEIEAAGIEPYNIMMSSINNTDVDIATPFEFAQKYEYHTFLAVLSHFGCFPKDMVSNLGLSHLKSIKNDIDNFSPTPELRDIYAPGGPCTPGKIRLFINANEEFYPCERVNETQTMCIGSLSKGFDLKNACQILNIGNLTESDCINCWAIRHCTLCAKSADNGSCLSGDYKRRKCSSVITSVEKKLKSIIMMKEIPEYYREFIKTDNC